jgi:endonuclease/exonuclease/phosphatase family metal-dependent hydrolase
MSYNIRCGSCEAVTDVNHWSRRRTLVADVIRKSGADLVGLQEAELFQVTDLVELLREFDWYGVGRDSGDQRGEMNAVLVRRSAFDIESRKTLWLSTTPQSASRGWDAMYHRTLTHVLLRNKTTGQGLHFLNTHFDHQGEQARLESGLLVARTAQALAEKEAVVLTGDLNLRSVHPAYAALVRVLQDTATRPEQPATGPSMTFNGFGKEIEPDNKIDFVFISRGLRSRSHAVIADLYQGLYPSDHFPVVSTIRH